MSEEATLPLAGVRVVDLGQIYNAPYATLLMALAGADVIKIEPLKGESLRKRKETTGTGAELPFFMLNSNKRGVCLDLKDERGKQLLWELVDRADVLVENFRPGVLAKLGFGYDALRQRRPSLVIASGSGYGQHGAYRDLPAMDLTIQAMSGVMASTGFTDAPPVKAGPAIADFFGGIHLYGAIVTALYRRSVTGEGAVVDVAMLDSVYPSLMSNIGSLLGSATPRARTGNAHGGLAVCPYNVYSTKDGAVAVITVSDAHWRGVLDAMGRAELADDARCVDNNARVAHMAEVDQLVEDWTSTDTSAAIFAALRARGVPCAQVRSLADVVFDPHFRERGLLEDIEFEGIGTLPVLHSPLRFDGEARLPLRPSPGLGADNRSVYGDLLGHSSAELDELARDGVI